MMPVAVLAVVLGIAQIVSGQGFNPDGATFLCQNEVVGNDTDDKVVFEYTEIDAADRYVQAFIQGQQANPACRADKIGGVITLTVAVGTCGLVADGDNVVSVHVLLVETVGFVTEWDYKFYFHCDFDLQPMQNVTSSLTAITDNIQNGTVNQKVEDVTLRVVTDVAMSIQQVLDTCKLGDSIKLRLDLVPSSSAVGAYGINCVVGPDAVFTRSLDFITDRCVINSNNGGLLNFQGYIEDDDTGFGVEVVQSPIFMSDTNDFKCFRFSDSTSLHFQCKIGFCSARDVQCDMDNCFNKPARRRRRDVEESPQKEVVIKIDISNRSSTSSTVNGPQPAECKPEHIYMYNTAFIAVIAILSVLLVLSVGSTMFVCMRTRRVRTGEKGEDNPAF